MLPFKIRGPKWRGDLLAWHDHMLASVKTDVAQPLAVLVLHATMSHTPCFTPNCRAELIQSMWNDHFAWHDQSIHFKEPHFCKINVNSMGIFNYPSLTDQSHFQQCEAPSGSEYNPSAQHYAKNPNSASHLLTDFEVSQMMPSIVQRWQ